MPGDEKRNEQANGGAQAKGEAKAVKAKFNSYSNYIPTRAVKDSSGWVYAPANLKLLKLAEHEMMGVAVLRGIKVRQPSDVRYVRAAMIEGQTVVHIFPTNAKDKDRIEIRRNSSGAWINLITLLADEGLLVEAGYKESFVINAVGDEGHFGPAITLDMAKPTQRKLSDRRKKDAGSTPAAELAAGSDENE